MLKEFINNISTTAKEKIQTTAENIYKKASPEVQKQLDKIISAKVDDVCGIVCTAASIAVVGYFVLRSVDTSGDSSTDIVPTTINNFDEVNITYNYFLKGDN